MKTLKHSREKSRSRPHIARSLSGKKINKSLYHEGDQSSKTPDESKRKKLSQNRQLLTQTLDTYTLLVKSNHPIRCLVHNCNISLYCQTEQKLLCANCVFSRNDHKFHRVTPVDKSYDKIENDVDTMNRLIDRELQNMKHTAQNLRAQLTKEEKQTHDGLSSLINIYEESHQFLERSFLRSKERILSKFQNARHAYESLAHGITQLIQDYGVAGIIKNIHKQPYKREQMLLFQHAVGSAIVAQKKFEQKEFVYDKKQLLNCIAAQKKRIVLVLEMMKKSSLK